MLEFVVYSRQGCHLCEQLLEELEPLCRGKATIVVHDIDSRPEWAEKYATLIPVLSVEGEEVCHHFLDRQRVLDVLAEAAS